MQLRSYNAGLDILGARKLPARRRAILVRRTDVFGVDKAVLIHLSDVASTVRAQGGPAGGIAYTIGPETITNLTYNKMASKIRTSLKDENVPADVQVIDMPGAPKSTSSGILRDVLIGVGVAGLVELIMHFVTRRLK